MKRIKYYNQFLNESNDEFDEFNIDDEKDLEIDENFDDDILKIIYNIDDESWDIEYTNGDDDDEIDNPHDFDNFYDWFVNDIDEDRTDTTMVEDDNEIIFHIPLDLYEEYLSEYQSDNDDNVDNDDDEDEDEL
jgi:hypothetical protein